MNKPVWQALSAVTFFLSACAPSARDASSAATQTATATSSPVPTATQTATALPTTTATASITPLPTIPTFTPTFDVSTIVTVTPATAVICPLTNQNQEKIPLTYVDSIETILHYLNHGGEINELLSKFRSLNVPHKVKDITNDGVPDLIVVSGTSGIRQSIDLFWCEAGQYNTFPADLPEAETLSSDAIEDYSIKDLNQNGIPEVLSVGDGRVGLNVNLLEWNGKTFIDLTTSETRINASMINASKDDFELKDNNYDGIPELILKGIPGSWYYPGEPLRTQTDTYYWNGKTFSPSTSFNFPQYRFQAIQDGDNLTSQGKYNEATKLYQDAIDSKVLDWWSKERFESGRDAAIHSTTPPALNPDTTEYPRLAAYTYYRIMLLHIVQRNESDATTTYNTLQQRFGNDPYGSPYVEMATAFWDAYQSTHKMYDGCAAAIQYAAEHPEILIPLGSDYHGSQSHIYKPEDVCPFR